MIKKPLKLVSYNIHRCIGTDRRFDPARVLAVLREIDADIVALQEVDSGVFVKKGVCQVDFFSNAIDGEHVAGPTIDGPLGRYGNLLLTRGQVLDWRRLDLSMRAREPRGAVDAHIEIDGQKIRVVCAHLGLRPRERLLQVRKLLGEMGKEDPSIPTFVMGDFNEWLRLGRPVRYLDQKLGRTRALKTFPSRRPMLPLDRVWVKPLDALVALETHVTPLSVVASDHLPLKAVIDMTRLQPPHNEAIIDISAELSVSSS